MINKYNYYEISKIMSKIFTTLNVPVSTFDHKLIYEKCKKYISGQITNIEKKQLKLFRNNYIYKSFYDTYLYIFGLERIDEYRQSTFIFIMIDKNNRIAYLETISNDDIYFENNKQQTFRYKLIFDFLMKISLKLIHKIKNKYNLIHIETYNNNPYIKYKKENVYIIPLYLLLYGYNLYSYYGFIPINFVENNSQTTEYLLDYHKNIILNKSLLVKNIKNLKKYFKKYFKKEYKNKDNNIIHILEYIDRHQYMKLSTFLLYFIQKYYQKYGKKFIRIITKIINKTGITSLDSNISYYPLINKYYKKI